MKACEPIGSLRRPLQLPRRRSWLAGRALADGGARGSVATLDIGHEWSARGISSLLRGDVDQRCDVRRLGLDVVATNVLNLPIPDHGHCLVACQRSSGSPKAAKTKPRSRHSFYIPMALFHDIVQYLFADVRR
jgi:hypothetical protein